MKPRSCPPRAMKRRPESSLSGGVVVLHKAAIRSLIRRGLAGPEVRHAVVVRVAPLGEQATKLVVSELTRERLLQDYDAASRPLCWVRLGYGPRVRGRHGLPNPQIAERSWDQLAALLPEYFGLVGYGKRAFS